jgi:hypothetical protein
MNNPLFIVMFDDGERYFGKTSYGDSGWKEMPNKKIANAMFRLPTGDYMVMNNYDKYYQAIEAVKVLTGDNAGKMKLDSVHILGKRASQIIEYKIQIITGDIKVHLFDAESEYIKQFNPIGWH